MYMRSSDGKPDWEHAQIQMAIVRYMEQEYSQPTTLQKAADYFGYEPCYFSKLFKRLMGMTFLQYRNRLRVIRAVELLRCTDISVTDISGRCGFDSPRTFNRAFRDAMSRTPLEVRKTKNSASCYPAADKGYCLLNQPK